MTLRDILSIGAEPLELYEAFELWAAEQGTPLYPHQEEAILEVMTGNNVILTTPTGSGKSLVAAAAHCSALAEGQRTFYTAPIKALVSEKFFQLIDLFGAEKVGMMTGDAGVNQDAPIVCCTAEVLANLALRQGPNTGIGQVVMDEFHFYGDSERGWAWQVPLLEMTSSQFLLMSATLGDITFFEDELSERTGRPTKTITAVERPVPLEFSYAMTPIHQTIAELMEKDKAPIYVVHSTQAAAIERAQSMMSLQVATKEEKAAIIEQLHGVRFRSAFGKTLQRFLKHGVGVHHAGMLPKYRRLVEQLAQTGLLKVVCGTDTLGVGINLPIRTVLLTALTKFDGRRSRVMKAREFHQVVGRAGRAGYDTTGFVVTQAPDHVIENAQAAVRAANNPNKRSKAMVKKAPEGFVMWTEQTLEKLKGAEPERLQSHFRVSHAMVLNVIAREGNALAHMRELLFDNHEPRERQRQHVRRAIAIYRSLLLAGIVERLEEPTRSGRTVRLTIDLQTNFALNQPLSPFALAALDLLDPALPTFALDVVSVIEATLEDPKQVLFAQERKARGEAVATMKAEGVEYEARMEGLDGVSWPKPLAELLLGAFDVYERTNPWVSDYQLSPKSIVRDMYERAMNFNEYIAFYEAARVEGIVLRYLSDAYKALHQTVPDELKGDDLRDVEEWLGETVRQTDSSLLDEWDRLRDPQAMLSEHDTGIDDEPPPVSTNERAFMVLIRNALFRRVELAARKRFTALGELDGESGWTADRWREALEPYFSEHPEIGVGADARGPHMIVADKSSARRWQVRQILHDPAEEYDWAITTEIDLDASDAAGEAAVKVVDVGPMSAVG